MTIEAILSAIGIFFMTFGLSCLIGYVLGVVASGLFKSVDLSNHPILMMSVFVTMVYIPFLISGMFSFVKYSYPSTSLNSPHCSSSPSLNLSCINIGVTINWLLLFVRGPSIEWYCNNFIYCFNT